MTPAEELRQAAATIRQLAANATPGPWISDDQGDKIVRDPEATARDHTDDPCGEGPELEYVVDEPLYANPANGLHIALWDPIIAALVADLLEGTAKTISGLLIPAYAYEAIADQLAIARAIDAKAGQS